MHTGRQGNEFLWQSASPFKLTLQRSNVIHAQAESFFRKSKTDREFSANVKNWPMRKGGRYKRLKAFGNNLVTVQPLVDCGMSDDPDEGAMNHLCQVFDYQNGGYLDAGTRELAFH